jgi:multiple sugar transport system substrate-binding protein
METPTPTRRGATRRDLIKIAASTCLIAGVGPVVGLRPAYAAKRTLKILQWSHFVPAYDKWFNSEYVKEWGRKNDTEVIVDNINLGLIPSRAAAEVSAQKGHDLVMFLSPPSVYEDQVVDMKDVYTGGKCGRSHREGGTTSTLGR